MHESSFAPEITPGTEHYLTDIEFVAAARIVEGFWNKAEVSMWRNGVIPMWKGVISRLEDTHGNLTNLKVDAYTTVSFDTNHGTITWTLKQAAQAYLDQYLWVGSPWMGDHDATVSAEHTNDTTE